MTTDDSLHAIGDAVRLLTLTSTALLDSGSEESFDRYTRLAARLLKAPVSLVSLVDRDRQYFKSHFGLGEPWSSVGETPLSHSFCQHVVNDGQPLIIGDATRHDRVMNNPAVSELGVVAYLGIPLTTHTGQVLGSFCAIDHVPRRWTDDDVDLMDDLAAAVTSEIELRMLAGESLRRLRNLQQLENHRDEMVHMLVHDLRSPLSSLLAGLDGLSIVPGLSATHRAFVTRARRGGNLLIEMIDDILTVSSSEAGRLQLNLQRASPLSMINGALDQLHQLSAAAGVTLAAQAPDDISTVLVDVRLLERVLVNLVANGLAHTPKGGRVLVAAEEREADGAVVFSVADTGAGMSEVDAERVFEKFEQAGSIDGRRRGSFGLGLTFCRMIVEQHGGRIWADSHPGGGAIFRFTIPEVLQGDGSGGLPGRSK